MSGPITWGVFTKPWQTLDGAATGGLLASLGVTGAEVPIRPTAHVTPDTPRARCSPGSPLGWPSTACGSSAWPAI